MNDDTQQLVQLVEQGDDEAVIRLMSKHRSRLKQMVRARMDPRILGRVDPSDVIQEALTTAFEQLQQYLYQQPIPFYPWLRRIAWQKLVHHHQRHLDAAKRSVRKEQQYWTLSEHSVMQLAGLAATNLTTPSAAVARQETFQQVRHALDRLEKQDREILLQRYVEHMSIQEIASGLELSEAAAQMRQFRALQKLKRYLTAEAPE